MIRRSTSRLAVRRRDSCTTSAPFDRIMLDLFLSFHAWASARGRHEECPRGTVGLVRPAAPDVRSGRQRCITLQRHPGPMGRSRPSAAVGGRRRHGPLRSLGSFRPRGVLCRTPPSEERGRGSLSNGSSPPCRSRCPIGRRRFSLTVARRAPVFPGPAREAKNGPALLSIWPSARTVFPRPPEPKTPPILTGATHGRCASNLCSSTGSVPHVPHKAPAGITHEAHRNRHTSNHQPSPGTPHAPE